MNRIVNVDHLTISVSDFSQSRRFYAALFDFLGMKVMDEYAGAMGWKNGRSRFWILQADDRGRKRKHRFGDVGFHHYAFSLRSRKDVDDLEAFLKNTGAKIVDPAGEYYDNYYAVYFLDPDGLKLEGMHYGR
jgi:catechol 2,3-dioxygenase-like lactoylglutathione lyase family enzyme